MKDDRRGFLETLLGAGVASAAGLVALASGRANAQHGEHQPERTPPPGAPAPKKAQPKGSDGDPKAPASPMGHGAMKDMPQPASPAAPAAMKGKAMDHGGMPGMGKPPPLPKGAPPPGSPLYKRFTLDLRVVRHEIVPGVVAHMMGYNGMIPAPLIRVNEGDWVWVDFTNSSDEMHTIHWHGLILDYTMDGVPFLGQSPVMRGDRYSYVFQARPYGTHFYHCHFGTSMHMQAGMYGAIIIDVPDDPIRKKFPYTKEEIFVLSSLDATFVREQMNFMFARMRQRDALSARKRLDLLTQGLFVKLKELVKAVSEGYVPPYLLARTAMEAPRPNYFLLNGKAYPATKAVVVKEGEWVRFRFINAGNVSHSMHLHGHDFYHVCDDGAPLANPVRMNTIFVPPGKTADVVFLADNPGFFALHDHDVTHTTNNGVYPGGAMTHVEYEGFKGSYTPLVSIDE